MSDLLFFFFLINCSCSPIPYLPPPRENKYSDIKGITFDCDSKEVEIMSVLVEFLVTIFFKDPKSLCKKKFWSHDETSQNMLAINTKLTCVM